MSEVKIAIRKTNPDYDLVIERLHLYYDMKLVTFGIDKERNLIIQFPVFIQAYTQLPLILYEIETISIPIIDQNKQAHSYSHLWIDKPYIALNSETYITIWQQELRTCKRIGYEFHCQELFVVKHISKYSCRSAIYFNLDLNTIKENCKFNFHYKKTDITPTVLDGGNEIILANWPNVSTLYATLTMVYPLRYPVIYMCWSTEVYCVTVA